LPGVPTPATTLPTAETTFGQAPAIGTAAQYSRADHTHGTPPNLLPAHVSDANAHVVGGDLSGAVGNARVTGLQNFPVAQPGPADNGRVLTFRTNQWRLESVTGGNPNAVEHPPGLPSYEIVAAGRLLCRTGAANPFGVYNNLRILRVANGEAIFTFDKMRQPSADSQYVVKVLPELNERSPLPSPIFVYFGDFVTEPVGAEQVPAFSLRFRNVQHGVIEPGIINRSVVMIEVSRYAIAVA
jgi:hypothetical protein